MVELHIGGTYHHPAYGPMQLKSVDARMGSIYFGDGSMLPASEFIRDLERDEITLGATGERVEEYEFGDFK